MTVRSDSRYSFARNAPVASTRNGITKDRDLLYTRDRLRPDVELQAIITLSEGTRLDQLATTYSGKAHLYWVIADVNELFDHPMFVSTGTKIKIPAASVFTAAEGAEA